MKVIHVYNPLSGEMDLINTEESKTNVPKFEEIVDHPEFEVTSGSSPDAGEVVFLATDKIFVWRTERGYFRNWGTVLDYMTSWDGMPIKHRLFECNGQYYVFDGESLVHSTVNIGGSGIELVHGLGDSTEKAMSQAAVTNLYNQGYKLVGTATPSTTPVTLTGNDKVFYIATEEAVYSNFGLGNISELSVIRSENGSWKAEGLGVEFSKKTYNINLIGKGLTRSAKTFKLQKGNVYRISLVGNFVIPENIGSAQYLDVGYVLSDGSNKYLGILYNSDEQKLTVTFTAADATKYFIGVRAANGEIVSFEIENLSSGYLLNIDKMYPIDGNHNIHTALASIDMNMITTGIIIYFADVKNNSTEMWQYKHSDNKYAKDIQFWKPLQPRQYINYSQIARSSGYIYSGNGSIDTSQQLTVFLYRIPVYEADCIRVSIPVFDSENSVGFAFYDKGANLLSSSSFSHYEVGGSRSAKVVTIKVPKGASYFNTSYWSEDYRISMGIEQEFICELVYDDNQDIDLSYAAVNKKYVNTDSGELVVTSGNIAFSEMQPTYGCKFLDISMMILLNEINRGVAFYDKDKIMISSVRWSDIYVNNQQRGALRVVIPIPASAEYFNATYWAGNSLKSYNISTPFCCILTNNNYLYKTFPTIEGNFQTFIPLENYQGDTEESLISWSYDKLISEWDALQSEHAERISEKKILGYATAEGNSEEAAADDTTRPIYEYVIKPYPKNSLGNEEYLSTTPRNIVKVLICTGVHGNEKSASTGVLFFFQTMLKSLDDYYLSLSQNCEFHVIPCLNPWGYDNNQRNNARNVNINRNFGHNWEYQAGGNVNVKGNSPYSEKETQIVKDWINNNDMHIYLDVHDSAVTSSPKQGLFAYTYYPILSRLYMSYLRHITPLALSQYPDIFTDKQIVGFVGYVDTSGTITEAYFNNKTPFVATVENNRYLGGAYCRKEQIELAANQIANVIRAIINYSI